MRGRTAPGLRTVDQRRRVVRGLGLLDIDSNGHVAGCPIAGRARPWLAHGRWESHHHLKQSEVFRCRRGELTVTVEGETRVLRPGDEVHLAPGTRHSLVNAGDTECECAVEYRPAGRNEALLKLMHGYTWRTGKDPGPLAMGPFFGDADLYGPGPVWMQKALINGMLKPLGILFGRRRKVMAIAEQNYGRPIPG